MRRALKTGQSVPFGPGGGSWVVVTLEGGERGQCGRGDEARRQSRGRRASGRSGQTGPGRGWEWGVWGGLPAGSPSQDSLLRTSSRQSILCLSPPSLPAPPPPSFPCPSPTRPPPQSISQSIPALDFFAKKWPVLISPPDLRSFLARHWRSPLRSSGLLSAGGRGRPLKTAVRGEADPPQVHRVK